jgi:hypothetical protein
MYDNKEHCTDCACLVDNKGCWHCDEAEKDIEHIAVCPEGTFDHTKEEKDYIVPVTWEMCGFIKVKAKSPYEAFMKVKNDEEDYPLPKEKNYVDASFAPSFDTEEMIEEYTKMYKNGELKGEI